MIKIARIVWVILAGLAIGLSVIGMPVYYASIARTGAVLSGAIFNIQPAISIAVAWILYGEALTPVQLAGGALVLASVWGLQIGRVVRKPSPTDQGPA